MNEERQSPSLARLGLLLPFLLSRPRASHLWEAGELLRAEADSLRARAAQLEALALSLDRAAEVERDRRGLREEEHDGSRAAPPPPPPRSDEADRPRVCRTTGPDESTSLLPDSRGREVAWIQSSARGKGGTDIVGEDPKAPRPLGSPTEGRLGSGTLRLPPDPSRGGRRGG